MIRKTDDTSLMGRMDWDACEGFQIAPARIESPFPNGFRIAQFPDGSQKLQGAYVWREGLVGGVIWKELPVVLVDESGHDLAR